MSVGAILAAGALTLNAVESEGMTSLSNAPSAEYGETTKKSTTPSTLQTQSAVPSVLAPPAPTEEPG
ncbi:hypothetical protein GCM10023114_44050 [Mycolicibacterium sediminis]